MTQTYPASPLSFSTGTDAPSLGERWQAWRSTLPRRGHGVLGGVCAGLGQAWGVSANLVRFGVLIAAFLPGPMWVVYAAAWIAMPPAHRA